MLSFTHFYTGEEQLNSDSLLKVMQEAGIQQPEWEEIGNKLDFKKYLQRQNSANSFLDGWHAFARESQPSWKLLGIVLNTINYKHLAEQIQQKIGKLMSCQLARTFLHWIFVLKIYIFLRASSFCFLGGRQNCKSWQLLHRVYKLSLIVEVNFMLLYLPPFLRCIQVYLDS